MSLNLYFHTFLQLPLLNVGGPLQLYLFYPKLDYGKYTYIHLYLLKSVGNDCHEFVMETLLQLLVLTLAGLFQALLVNTMLKKYMCIIDYGNK